MRFLLLAILISPLFGEPSQISYAGMIIQCDRGCGEIDDPDIEQIMEVFADAINDIFSDCLVLDESIEGIRIHPWGRGDDEEWEYSVWDRNASKNLWPKTNALGRLDKNPPQKHFRIDTYSAFLKTSLALKEDVYFYYIQAPHVEISASKSLLSKLSTVDQYKYRSVDISDGGILELYDYGTSTSTCKDISELITRLKKEIKQTENSLPYWQKKYDEKNAEVERTVERIDAIFKRVFTWCLAHHQVEGIAFKEAIEDLISGDYDKALEKTRFLIDLAEKKKLNDELLSKLYLLQGQVQSEFCQYSEAVIDLTIAIQKNPSAKEAYFERAVAYFELGNFDQAIEDYLQADLNKKLQWATVSQLSAGITSGIIEGIGKSATEFIPETLGTLRGLGNGLWALITEPVGASTAFINAAIECVEYMRSHSVLSAAQEMVPELKILIQDYDNIGDHQKGQLLGQVIGKYGTDILFCKYSMTAVKAYRDLKKANQLMTLEALASPKGGQKILEEATKRWVHREEVLRNGNLKIHIGKQNKHIVQHMKPGDTKSILTHPEPQKLVDEFAGTGQKINKLVPGTPDYRERINFGEKIGIWRSSNGLIAKDTSVGMIIYSKDGVHIVPLRPIE